MLLTRARGTCDNRVTAAVLSATLPSCLSLGLSSPLAPRCWFLVMARGRFEGVLSWYHFLSLYLPAIMLALGQSMVAPVIPVLAKSFDVGFGTASLVLIAAQGGMLAATVPSGMLVDRIGRRPVLLAGPVLTAFASFMTPLAGSFPELLLYRFLGGVAQQLWQGARLTVIADSAEYGQRARQINWMQGMAQGGTLIGPTVGGLLAAAFGLQIPFVVHAGLTLLAIVPSFLIIKETAPNRGRQQMNGRPDVTDSGWRGLFAWLWTVPMGALLLANIFAGLCRGGWDYGALSLYAVYAYNIGPQTLGLMNTIAVIVGLPVPFVTGYLMDRHGRRAVILPSYTIYACSLLLAAGTAFLSLPFIPFTVCYVLVQASLGTTGGTMQVLGADASPAFARGRFFSVWRLTGQGGSTLSPGLFALAAEAVSYGAAFVTLGVCSLLVALLTGYVLQEKSAKVRFAEK